MAINTAAKKHAIPEKKAIDKFIEGAPDSQHGVIRGKRRIITIGYSPEIVDRADAVAKKLSISRAAFFNMIASKALPNYEDGE